MNVAQFLSAKFAISTFLVALVAAGAAAQDAIGPAAGDKLAPQSELDTISLSIVDEKLALTLAVEIHVQHELTEFALTGIQDENVRLLAENKRRLYAQLLNTLHDLTGGRSAAMLDRAPNDGTLKVAGFRPAEDVPAATATTVVAKTATVSTEGSPATPAVATRPKKRGGLSAVLENTTTAAIVKVRLKIAENYAELLRAELAALPPADFDRHYMQIEVFNQIQVMSMLRVFEQHASDAFARVLHHATVATEQHLADARNLVTTMPAGNLASPAVETASPQPAATSQVR
jgi:hypothetical protein